MDLPRSTSFCLRALLGSRPATFHMIRGALGHHHPGDAPSIRPHRIGAVAILTTLLALITPAPSASANPALPNPATAPIPGSPVRGFSAPDPDWLPGHRGIDIAGDPGQRIEAAAAGTVAFVGVIDGVPIVTIDHGDVRTTYQPVRSLVDAGQSVELGQVIGELEAGHPGCPAEACLHWGLKRGDTYLDPTSLLGDATEGANTRVRLLPENAMVVANERADERVAQAPPELDGAAPPAAPGKLAPPSTGTRTSPFGMRLHPVLNVWKLHDGLDFGAPCGAPIRASADGVVIETHFNAGYGNLATIEHDLDGRKVRTRYTHAIDFSVNPGDQVRMGQVIGRVGSTGYSTGCHLHFMVWVDGQLVDPASWL
ncbi:peptidoglycan DD-metalloendopeptidase family protein [Propioniferax innocua]|uniref:peptidoglycan DD-metalloendopeptidase family protein n=1 Tax=Propioniferax innocua TaxID=1753 RepID=UPI001152F2EF|nr:peptidoglycan DD-metalloendopeptidase family protein [Propioniferax innocua]